jgi:hypothetical protein
MARRVVGNGAGRHIDWATAAPIPQHSVGLHLKILRCVRLRMLVRRTRFWNAQSNCVRVRRIIWKRVDLEIRERLLREGNWRHFARLLECLRSGRVAQLGEHRVRNAGVGGSNPLSSTIPRFFFRVFVLDRHETKRDPFDCGPRRPEAGQKAKVAGLRSG